MLKSQLATVCDYRTSHIIDISLLYSDQARFLIFTFKFDIMMLEVYYREAIQSQCLLPMLYVNIIITYIISGVPIICAYNINDFYHTGQIYVCACIFLVLFHSACTCI